MKKIPNIEGMHIDDAKELLKKENIEINEEIKKFSLNTRKNYVIKTEPEVETNLTSDNKIDIYVSRLKLLPILIFLMLLGLLGLGGTAYYLSTAPKIDESEKSGHGDNKVIEVIDDSHMISGDIDYYLYCINSENNIDTCVWERTDTKNVEIAQSGKWYVWFKAVSKSGEVSAPSEVKEVNVDNEAPMVNALRTKSTKTTIDVRVILDDNYEENLQIFYSIDNSTYVESNNRYTFENLTPNTIYLIKVKIVDEKGNEYILSRYVRTKPLDSVSDEENTSDSDNDNSNNNIDDKNDEEKNDEEKNDEEKNDEKDDTDDEEKNDEKDDTDDEEKLQAPRIDLSGVPTVIKIGDSYSVPTSYWFDDKGGEVVCKIEDDSEITNTNELLYGDHIITCTAKANNGLTAQVSKFITVNVDKGEDEEFNGWIRLNLFYPSRSINRQYIIKNPDEINTGYNTWLPYTGPVLVNLNDVNNVYIKYTLNGKTYIVSPSGKMVVDIEPDSYKVYENNNTKVSIYYDENATIKQYRLNGGAWIDYEGEFEVSGGTLIEARGSKNEKVYDSDGNLAYEQVVSADDNAYISLMYKNAISKTSETSVETYPYNTSRSVTNSYSTKVTDESGNDITDINQLSVGTHTLTYKDGNETYTKEITIESPNYEVLEGPIISSSNNADRALSTTISISTKEEASAIYYSINGGTYEKYIDPFELNDNTVIRAYYTRKSDGKTSKVSSLRVNNISDGPVINVNYKPDYLTTYTDKTIATISAKYNTGDIEYSFDGEIYNKYTSPLNITSSCTLYVRAHDSNNKYKYYSEKIILTTAPKTTASKMTNKLDISISTKPEKTSTKVNSVEVTINYDANATKKYYKLNKDEDWKEYTGSIILSENKTVYAYATNENGDKGYATKVIDYLYDGIAEPTFNVVPNGASSVYRVEINYADNAVIKRYSLDGTNYYDYTEPLYIYNNITIYAQNSDELGNSATSSHRINSIVKLPKIQVIDKGKYLYIKLNYPDFAETREYKWKDDGVWKNYPETGILLVYPEFKDEFDSSVDFYSVEDQEGNKVKVSKEHTYVLDVLSSDIFYNLFMRWDSTAPSKATFIKNTEEPAKNVRVWINYDDTAVKRLFKLQYSDGTQTDWMNYTDALDIVKNNVTIYAKSMNEGEIYSDVSSITITNVDDISPTINVVGDLTTHKRKVTFAIDAKDNMKLDSVAYLKGNYDADYVRKYGIYTKVNKPITVEENGTYTLFAVDSVGNMTTKQIEITNVDINTPAIFISTSNYEPSDTELVTSMDVTIDYDDSIIKKYSFDNINWIDYTGTFNINSFDVSQYKNDDNSLTIYAKGIDEAENESNVFETIYNLDLDIPEKPEINIKSGYPIINEYGVELDYGVSMSFDNRDDIINYYCLSDCSDNNNWKIYNNSIKIINSNGTIYAKSVKNNSNLTVTSNKDYSIPEDALQSNAWDKDENSTITLNGTEYLRIDASMIGKKIKVLVNDVEGIKYAFTNDSKTKITSDINITNNESVITIPSNAKYLSITGNNKQLNEVKVDTEATFNNTSVYPIISESGVTEGYNNVLITYTSTAVTKQYSYDNVNWLPYENKSIKVAFGNKLYARQIDKYNNIGDVSTYESRIDDKLSDKAYDKNNETYDEINNNAHRININSNVRGKILNVLLEDTSSVNASFYNQSNNLITTDQREGTLRTLSYVIPNSASYVTFSGTTLKVYEVSISNLPDLVANPKIVVSDENKYTLTKTVTIYYPGNQYTNEYSLDNGNTWIRYEKPFEINHYTTIIARSTLNNEYISSSTYKVNKLASLVNYVTGDDNVEIDPKLVLYGTEYGYLAEPNRVGYDFAGWYLDEALTQSVTNNTLVANTLDHNIYAKWTPHTYNISIDAIHGTVSENKLTIDHNGTSKVTITPDAGYSLKSAECDNGYTITSTLGSEIEQEVTINNNGNVGNSTCALSFKHAYCNVNIVGSGTQTDQGGGRYTCSADYKCNGTTGTIQTCYATGKIGGYKNGVGSSNVFSVSNGLVSTTGLCSSSAGSKIRGSIWVGNIRNFGYMHACGMSSQIDCSCDEINVKVNVEGGTASSNLITVMQSGSTEVTITPNQDDYQLESVSCSNGYTVSNVLIASASTDAGGQQTVTIKNNGSLDDSICTFKYRKYCNATQDSPADNRLGKTYSLTANYKCNGESAVINKCYINGYIYGYPPSGGLIGNVYVGTKQTPNTSPCTTARNSIWSATIEGGYNTSNMYGGGLPTTIPCSCDD